MSGFSLPEVGLQNHIQHWLRGGFPLSFLAPTEAESQTWRDDFIRMFLSRDLPQWGITAPTTALARLWAMLAHYHGQIWNAADPARSLGLSQNTIRRYLDILTDVFMIR